MTRFVVIALVVAACAPGSATTTSEPETSGPTASNSQVPTTALASTTSTLAPLATPTAAVAPTVTTPIAAAAPTCDPPATFVGGGADVDTPVLYGFDATGTRLWTMNLPSGYGYDLTGGGPFVVISSRSGIAAIDPATCRVLWEAATTNPVTNADTSEASLVHAGNRDLTRVDYSFDTVWSVSTDAADDIAVMGDLVLVVSENSIDVRSLGDGSSIGTQQLDGSSAVGRMVAASAEQGALVIQGRTLTQVDVTGRILSSYDAGADIVDAVLLSDEHAIVLSDTLSLVNMGNGIEQWTVAVPSSRQPLVVSHREIHLVTLDGELRHYDLNGDLVFTGNHSSDFTFVADDDLVVETSAGKLQAFTMLEQKAWSVDLGRDTSCVYVDAKEIGGVIVVLTWDSGDC